MVKILFTCHVEPDRLTGDIDYLKNFLIDLNQINQPVLLLLMVGDSAKSNILNFFRINKLTPKKCRLGLHIHGHAVRQGINLYQKSFQSIPRDISFGHWQYVSKDISTASKMGVKADYSFAAYRHDEKYFFKEEFKDNDLKERPVCCNPKYPVNPFYGVYNLFIFFLLVTFYFFSNRTLHFSFHSFDWNKKLALIIFNLPVDYVVL